MATQREPTQVTSPSWRRFLAPSGQRRTYRELSHLLADLPIGVAWFTVMVTLVATGAGMAVTVVGLPLLAVTMVVARRIGDLERSRAGRLLGTTIPAPLPLPAVGGRWATLRIRLTDPVAWRAFWYSVLLLPVGVLTFSGAVTAYAISLGAVTLPAWYGWLPKGGAQLFPGVVVRTPGQLALVAVIGVVWVPFAAWVVRGCANLDRALVRWLLSPVSLTRQVESLRTSRDLAVDAAAAERRRIERDLHDGAQAHLVAVTMELGRARERLRHGPDPEAAVLVDEAHHQAKQALAELRNLARGIHPAVLTNGGLDAAISSLVAACPVPVEVVTNLEARLPMPIESAAYFVVAEALANVARHSAARSASVEIAERTGGLAVEVRDNGRGGAVTSRGTGLAGLHARVAALGGHLSVVSPHGGPTTVFAEIPCEL